MLSLVVPIYKSEANIPDLITAIEFISDSVDGDFEAVFVVDGSPDNSYNVLKRLLSSVAFNSQLVVLSRNFGAFAAIRAGLQEGAGQYFAVLAADLQEPPELVTQMYRSLLAGECEVAVGKRAKRDDPMMSRFASSLFWWLYRSVMNPDIPPGGVDIFACNGNVRDELLRINERNSSLIGLLFWIGFRRKEFPYARAKRTIGKSGWSFAKKWKYMQDSVFSFTNLPITVLLGIGFFGLIASFIVSLSVFYGHISGSIDVPGYAATMIAIIFFGMLQIFSLGVLGIYVWRVFENTKGRPLHIIMRSEKFGSKLGAPEN